MPRSNPQRLLAVGIALVAAGAALWALGLDVMVFFVGLLMCVSAAALAASGTPRTDRRGGTSRGPVLAVCVLGTVALVPFAVVGVLLVVDADPVAVLLIGAGTFALAGVLTAVFLTVFLVNVVRNRRAAGPGPVDQRR